MTMLTVFVPKSFAPAHSLRVTHNSQLQGARRLLSSASRRGVDVWLLERVVNFVEKYEDDGVLVILVKCLRIGESWR